MKKNRNAKRGRKGNFIIEDMEFEYWLKLTIILFFNHK